MNSPAEDKPPFFSVIIPTYNRAHILLKTLNSVLAQTFPDFEVIVIDNCSTDSTAEVMKAYKGDKRVIYIRNEKNFERSYSRNTGLRTSKGNFATLLDSDDMMYRDCLQDAYDFVLQNPNTIFFRCLFNMINEEGKKIVSVSGKQMNNQHLQICKSNFISCIGTFLHHQLAHRFFFAEDRRMIGAEDYEIWFRVLAENRIDTINKVNCGITEHPERSVYSPMYENLEFQRKYLTDMIKNDPALMKVYGKHIGYINANFYYHDAMYRLHKGERKKAWTSFIRSFTHGKGMLFSRRSPGFIKNFFSGLIMKK